MTTKSITQPAWSPPGLNQVQEQDDRRRARRGLVLSVAQKADGTLRLSMDGVVSDGSVFPDAWKFQVFQNHFTLDQGFIELIEKEIQKPLEEMNYTPPPDLLIQMLGHALLVPLISAAIDARKAGIV